MKDAYIKFEETGREGVIAVGSYLIDAAKRLGIDIECGCGFEEEECSCVLIVNEGAEFLSDVTSFESEHMTAAGRKKGHRLACQAKIEKPGDLVVMTVKKEPESSETSNKEDFKKEFEQLPLDQKIASLVELEAIALGETLSYVINSPYKAVGKVMDIMAGFGRDMEEKEKEAKVPDEHRSDESEKAKSTNKSENGKSATSKKKKPSKAKQSKAKKEVADKDKPETE